MNDRVRRPVPGRRDLLTNNAGNTVSEILPADGQDPCEGLGECVGFFVSETGPIEQVVQIFGYQDWGDRDRKRAALWADERFTAMSAELHPLIQSKESQLFRNAPGWSPAAPIR